jgi:hypothetical protein
VVWREDRVRFCAAISRGVRLSYNSFLTDAAEVVHAVHEEVAAAREATGACGVHLIGHSLGGLLLRYALECDTFVVGPATVVTIATPHAGVRLARWMPGFCARLMHPGSATVRARPREHRAIRWIIFSSDGDRVVPPSSARLGRASRLHQPAHPQPRPTDHLPGPGSHRPVVHEVLGSERCVADAAVRPACWRASSASSPHRYQIHPRGPLIGDRVGRTGGARPG